jgi:hypothetical protein
MGPYKVNETSLADIFTLNDVYLLYNFSFLDTLGLI